MRQILCTLVCLGAAVALQAQENQAPDRWNEVHLLWQTPPIFQTPEAVLYDSKRNVLYVSNYQLVEPPSGTPQAERPEYLSKLDMDGKVIALQWVRDLKRPTGMTIYRDSLYVVERDNLVRIDMDQARIKQRFPIQGADFPNDIVFDANGVGYISDNGQNPQYALHRFKDGRISPWLSADQVLKPNGLLIEGQDLVAYDNRRQALVRINCKTQAVKVIAKLPASAQAMGDGMVQLDEQTYLVTAWGGPSWIIKQDGSVTALLDTGTLTPVKGRQVNNADAGWIPGKKTWVIPTFSDGRLLAYQF